MITIRKVLNFPFIEVKIQIVCVCSEYSGCNALLPIKQF